MAKINIDENLLSDLFKQGILIKDIALQFNCDRNTITKRLQKLGLKEGVSYKETIKKQDPLLEKKEKIKELYLSGKTCKDIGNLVNLSERTVLTHLCNMGVKIRNRKKIDQTQFEQLWREGKTDEEIATFFGVKVTTIKTYRTKGANAGKFKQIRYFSQTEQQLTDLQEQFILGSLLGDLSLSKPTGNTNSRLKIVHCEAQKELFMEKVNLLGNFMGNYKLIIPKPDSRTGKVYKTYRGDTLKHPVFTEIYNLLYINGIKTINQEFLNKIHHPIALAYWFMDDGTYRGTFATNSFSSQECLLLQDWLLKKWNISVTLQVNKPNHVLHIKSSDRLNFEKLIFPYMVPSMYYKLKFLHLLQG